eukprot:1193272-Prorocentrum_minimum.AAC.6
MYSSRYEGLTIGCAGAWREYQLVVVFRHDLARALVHLEPLTEGLRDGLVRDVVVCRLQGGVTFRGGGKKGKYRSSVDARELQDPTKSEELEYQRHLQGCGAHPDASTCENEPRGADPFAEAFDGADDVLLLVRDHLHPHQVHPASIQQLCCPMEHVTS